MFGVKVSSTVSGYSYLEPERMVSCGKNVPFHLCAYFRKALLLKGCTYSCHLVVRLRLRLCCMLGDVKIVMWWRC